jgi:hypothetical protein
LSLALASYEGRSVPMREVRQLSAESQRASEIVSRLVSFARPQDAEPRLVDATALVNSLIQFREPEWKSLGLRVQNRLGPEPAMVLGVQGQLEQVFLNLLVHAEQCAEGSPKSIVVASSMLAGRIIFEITYSSPNAGENDEMSADSGAVGLAASQGILLNHGGELRFRSLNGGARFEVELPIIQEEPASANRSGEGRGRAITVLLVDNEPGAQRQLLGMLSARGHRVVPVTPDEAGDLAQRLRFDMVIWTMRPSGPRWSEMQDRVRQLTPGFVLLTEAYDAGLALSIEEGGGFLLSRPIMDAELDRVLRQLELRLAEAAAARK